MTQRDENEANVYLPDKQRSGNVKRADLIVARVVGNALLPCTRERAGFRRHRPQSPVLTLGIAECIFYDLGFSRPRLHW